MKIVEDIIASLDPNADISDIRQGVFQTAVITRHCGLASTPHDLSQHQHGMSMVTDAGILQEGTASELVRLARSEKGLEAAIGMAAINSLIDVDIDRCEDLNAADLIMKKGAGKTVAIIGHFPFAPRLKDVAKKLSVIEKNPHEGDHSESEAADLLPEADVVGITGVTLLNHTFDEIIAYCRNDAFIVMLGGTTPLSPVLFDYGIDAIAGTLVTDPVGVMHAVSQGATFRQIKGKRLLTMRK